MSLTGVVISLEHRHRAPDDDHVIPQGLDLRRQELVTVAEQVERVANHGGEQLAAGPREELFVRSPERRHVRYGFLPAARQNRACQASTGNAPGNLTRR